MTLLLKFWLFYIVVGMEESGTSGIGTCKWNNDMDSDFIKKCDNVVIEKEEVYLNQSLQLFGNKELTIEGNNNSITCLRNSGIYFCSMKRLTIRNVQFFKCGLLHPYKYLEALIASFQAALHFFNISEVSISGVTISDSIGAGLVILNCKQVGITESKFINNSWDNCSSLNNSLVVAGGGGVHVELSCGSYIREIVGSHCSDMKLSISKCSFFHNQANNLTIPHLRDFGETIFTSFGKGGGLSIHFRDNTTNNTAMISNCTFRNNSAKYGGGVEIVLSNRVESNEITVSECTFERNKALNSSGALDIGFVGEGIDNNNICIVQSTFIENHALSGGAVSIFFLYSTSQKLSSVLFHEVQWIGNYAHYGAAIFTHPLRAKKITLDPRIRISNATIINNIVTDKSITSGMKHLGEGIIMTTRQNLEFFGYILFFNNSASCIYATSSIIYFKKVYAEFVRNSASYGAGLSLIGFSSMNLGDNSTLIFCNNTVSFYGSAVYYYSIDKSSYIYFRFCFVQMPSSKKTIKIYLWGNKSPMSTVHTEQLQSTTSIIYATTYASCALEDIEELSKDGVLERSDKCHLCQLKLLHTRMKSSMKNPDFPCKDELRDESDKQMYVICNSGMVSAENEIKLRETTMEFIPGMETQLPIDVASYISKACSGFNKKYQLSYDLHINYSSFAVSIKNFNNSKINSSRLFITTSSLSYFSLSGKPGDHGQLILTETGFRKLQLTLSIKAIDCPPLFKLNHDKCKCVSGVEVPYSEFHNCSYLNAKIRLGFWIGYEDSQVQSLSNDKVLLVSHCPPGFCNKSVDKNNYLSLPQKFDLDQLNNVICNNREGTLCGICQNNYTVYFHASTYKCKKATLCYLGPLFYLLTEIAPLTLLLLVVIYFDIRFTSGSLNGFIFFAQMYNSISQIGDAFVENSSQYYQLNAFVRVIYRFFDFDFFSLETLSFCLFYTRTALAAVAFKYVTIVYALLLIFGMVWFLNICGTKLKCIGLRQFKYSALQGLSAFLVISYSQCVQVSFTILNFVRIYKDNNSTQVVPFLQGNIKYLGREHLAYAIPAMICILTIVIALPTLLILYPLSHKAILLLKLETNCIVKCLSRFFPISHLKPLLDSLQGSFKDEFRFFAGLYFVYRVVIIVMTIQERIEWIHTLIEIELVCILGIHMTAWPYQKRLHNIMDALMFCNLTLIVILKRFIFTIAEKGKQFQKEITTLHLAQLFLISVPLVVILMKILYKVVQKVRQHIVMKKKDQELVSAQSDDDIILDANTREGSFGGSYMLMKESRLHSIENLHNVN